MPDKREEMESLQKETLEMHVLLIREQMFRHVSKHMENMYEQMPNMVKTHVESEKSDIVKMLKEKAKSKSETTAGKKGLTDDNIRCYKAVAEIRLSFPIEWRLIYQTFAFSTARVIVCLLSFT
jgi:hypothetical protein